MPRYKTATADQERLLTRSKPYFLALNEDRPPLSYNAIMEREKFIQEQKEANAKLIAVMMRALEEEEEESVDDIATN